MEKIWHKTKEGDYPKVFGEYCEKQYPQIPCLVEFKYKYCICYWNVVEDCWDDEEGDDYFCRKEDITRWDYLEDLINLK